MSENQNDTQKPRNIYYPIMILVGIAGNVVSSFSNLQAIYSTFGIFFSTLLIGVGVIGFFVNQRRISLRDGVLYAIIWTMLMALAVAGYYILISRASSVYGILLDNANTRNPVPNIEVSLYVYSTGATNRVRTTERGEFQFDDVSNGEFDVIINDISIYSGDVPIGFSKLVETNVNTGRFYLDNLVSSAGTTPPISSAPQPTNTSSPTDRPTQAPVDTSTPTLTRTPRPTSTPRPPTNTPTFTPSPTDIPESAILFEEDFESGEADRFSVLNGRWAIEADETGNMVYTTTPSDWPQSGFGSFRWQNYVVEADVRIIEPGDHELLFMIWFLRTPAIGGEQSYAVGFNSMTSIDLFYLPSWTYLTGYQPIQVEEDIWYRIRIEVEGTNIRVFLDDTLLISTVQTRLNSGSVALNGGPRAIVQFDNIRVWSLNLED